MTTLRTTFHFATCLVVALLLCLGIGCSDDSNGSRSNSSADQEPHYDCFPYFTCRDGVVYWQSGGVIPGDEYEEGMCDEGHQVGACEQGCRTDGAQPLDSNEEAWVEMCEEGRRRGVGEPCTADTDCEPAEEYYDPTESEYRPKPLECDTETSRCIDPEHEDYGAWCDLPQDELGEVDSNESAYLPASSCTDGYCLLHINAQDREICQGCTLECDSDADCPAGSTCRNAYFYSDGAAEPGPEDERRKLCSGREDAIVECRGTTQ